VDWAAVEKALSVPGVTLKLQWEELRETHPDGVITLADSKTGPRTVLLGEAAQSVVEALPGPRDPDAFLFPKNAGRDSPTNIVTCWRAVCDDPKLGKSRLHDLRHTAASHAVMSGENLPLAGESCACASPAYSGPQATADALLRAAILMPTPELRPTDAIDMRAMTPTVARLRRSAESLRSSGDAPLLPEDGAHQFGPRGLPRKAGILRFPVRPLGTTSPPIASIRAEWNHPR